MPFAIKKYFNLSFASASIMIIFKSGFLYFMIFINSSILNSPGSKLFKINKFIFLSFSNISITPS